MPIRDIKLGYLQRQGFLGYHSERGIFLPPPSAPPHNGASLKPSKSSSLTQTSSSNVISQVGL